MQALRTRWWQEAKGKYISTILYIPEFSFKILIFDILLFSGTNDSVLNDLFYAMFCIFNKK